MTLFSCIRIESPEHKLSRTVQLELPDALAMGTRQRYSCRPFNKTFLGATCNNFCACCLTLSVAGISSYLQCLWFELSGCSSSSRTPIYLPNACLSSSIHPAATVLRVTGYCAYASHCHGCRSIHGHEGILRNSLIYSSHKHCTRTA